MNRALRFMERWAVPYQLGLVTAAFVFVGLATYLEYRQPMSAMDHANRLCQEIYGPQTGATWTGDRMMCETVRGEILPVKRPK